MKTQYLLYDRDCALCKCYTNLFIRFGFLKSDQRLAYQDAANDESLKFDRLLAKVRIALVSPSEGEVYYGYRSLIEVLGNRWGFMKRIGLFPPIYAIFNLLYLFISYNRKVISPAVCEGSCDCAPPTHHFFRWLYIAIVMVLVNHFMFGFFSTHLHEYMKPLHYYSDAIWFITQIAVQLVFFYALKQRDVLLYLGNLATVSLIALILLTSGSFVIETMVQNGLHVEVLFPIFYGVIIMFMFYEHKRRVRVLGLNQLLSWSFVLSRLILFFIAFNY